MNPVKSKGTSFVSLVEHRTVYPPLDVSIMKLIDITGLGSGFLFIRARKRKGGTSSGKKTLWVNAWVQTAKKLVTGRNSERPERTLTPQPQSREGCRTKVKTPGLNQKGGGTPKVGITGRKLISSKTFFTGWNKEKISRG